MKQLLSIIVSIFLIMGCASSDEETSSSTSSSSSSNSTKIPKIELVGTIYKNQDSYGKLKLFGEVKNSGEATATFVKTKCLFYDSASNLIDEDFTYVNGTVLTLKSTKRNTDTTLKAGESGYFKIWSDSTASSVSTYKCDYTYDIDETVDPSAKLEITGNVTAKNSSSKLELLGSAKNTGSSGLTFGQIYFVIKNSAGEIVDIDWDYINGETVILTSSSSTTDTALNVGSSGTFSLRTNVPFSSYSSYTEKYDWDDSTISNGKATRSMDKKRAWALRNQSIDELKSTIRGF